MKKTTKIWLLAAVSLVLLGSLLFVGVMTACGWNFAKLSTASYETKTYEINEPFGDISLTADTAGVVFALSDDGKCRVECYEEINEGYSVAVEKETLVVRSRNQKAWYASIGFHFDAPKITVYLPQTQYNTLTIAGKTGNVEIPETLAFENVAISLSTGNVDFCASASGAVRITTSTGNIRVERATAGAFDLSVATGRVIVSAVNCRENVTVHVSTGVTYLTDLSCKSVVSVGTTGDISLQNVVATERFSVERSTGRVKFDRCDAAEIYVKTTTGAVTGSFLSDKVFVIDTARGSVDVPPTVAGGRCEIRTSTGDIRIQQN